MEVIGVGKIECQRFYNVQAVASHTESSLDIEGDHSCREHWVRAVSTISTRMPRMRVPFSRSKEIIAAGVMAEGFDHLADGGLQAGEEGAANDGVADIEFREVGNGEDWAILV